MKKIIKKIVKTIYEKIEKIEDFCYSVSEYIELIKIMFKIKFAELIDHDTIFLKEWVSAGNVEILNKYGYSVTNDIGAKIWW